MSRKSRNRQPETPTAVPLQAKDPVQKEAINLHADVQDLSRRAGELELRAADLDEQLKRSREETRHADARTAELAAKAARVDDLELELATLRRQIDQVQTWSAELSAQAAQVPALEKEVAALREAADRSREELKKAQEEHHTVIRAKDEKVEAAEKRSREGMKRLKDAHDSALRDEAARATAAEKAAREDLKKLQDLHESMIREASPLRTQIAELRAQVDKPAADEHRDRAGKAEARVAGLQKDVEALSQQVGQMLGARDKSRRELDEARSQLNHERDEAKKTLEARQAAEQEAAALRVRVADFEQKSKEPAPPDPRIAPLQKDLAAAREETSKAKDAAASKEREASTIRGQVGDLERRLREASREDPRIAATQKELSASKSQVADLERKLRESPKEDPRIAGLQKDLAVYKERAEKGEARAAEAARYFESMEKALVEAQAEADRVDAVREELEQTKETCREQEEGLEQLSQTVLELEQQLQDTTATRAVKPVQAQEPPPAPPPPSPVVVEAPIPVKAAAVEPVRIEIDEDPVPEPVEVVVEELPPPAPLPVVVQAPKPPPPRPVVESPKKPAPAPVVVPPSIPVPTKAASETTLRSNNTFGPEALDGQPAYLLHEMLPNDLMGVVYRATERADGRAFAVRFMAGQAGEEQTRAFESEVEKLTGLPHPNILHVQGSGRRKNRLYVMMDYVNAPTLAAAKIHEVARICAILHDAASAIHYAHEEGIFHGNITPENILVDREEDKDKALVKDFGFAYLLETQAGGLRNPAFLPPEQVRVLKTPLSAAVDVYGLGATLFAVLTGKPPFEGKDAAQIVKRVMIEEPPPVEKIRPDVPKAVGAVVRRAMAKERGVRYASAGELAEALAKIR